MSKVVSDLKLVMFLNFTTCCEVVTLWLLQKFLSFIYFFVLVLKSVRFYYLKDRHWLSWVINVCLIFSLSPWKQVLIVITDWASYNFSQSCEVIKKIKKLQSWNMIRRTFAIARCQSLSRSVKWIIYSLDRHSKFPPRSDLSALFIICSLTVELQTRRWELCLSSLCASSCCWKHTWLMFLLMRFMSP